jgi:hypothetical protein
LDSTTKLFTHIDDLPSSGVSLTSHVNDGFQEKFYPLFPLPKIPNFLKTFIIVLPILFEISTEIEEWLIEDALGAQIERDQKSAHPAISIKERMYRFKLCVY